MANLPVHAAGSSVSIESAQERLKSIHKRPASASLSESETLVTITANPKDNFTSEAGNTAMRTRSVSVEVHRRKRRKKKISVTKAITRNLNTSIIKSNSNSTGNSSPKGKEKEVIPEETLDEEKEKELTSLREQVQNQETALSAHKLFMEQLAPSLTCQICLEPMYRPYTLAPCGHTACYSCLLSWFRAVPQHIPQPPPPELIANFDPDEPQLLARGAPLLIMKKKNCPHCRADIREAPIEAWGIKDIVSHLIASKSNIATQVFPTLETREEDSAQEPAGAEAWKGVFSRDDAQARILPVPNSLETAFLNEERGFFDEEDQVYRCTSCFNEVWNGQCTSCGRVFPGHHNDSDDDSLNSDIEERAEIAWMDAQDYILADHSFQERILPTHFPFSATSWFERRMGLNIRTGDEDGYESSFIDDDDDENGVEYHSAAEANSLHNQDNDSDQDPEYEGRSRVARLFDSSPRAVRPGNSERRLSNARSSAVAVAGSERNSPGVDMDPPPITLGSSDDEAMSSSQDIRRRGAVGRRAARSHAIIESAESGDGEEETLSRPSRGRTRVVLSDDEEEEAEEQLFRLAERRRAIRSLFTRGGSLSDDDDEEDYEHSSPVINGSDHDEDLRRRAYLFFRDYSDIDDSDDGTHNTSFSNAHSANYMTDEGARWSDHSDDGGNVDIDDDDIY